jgi:hypothetical protein
MNADYKKVYLDADEMKRNVPDVKVLKLTP